MERARQVIAESKTEHPVVMFSGGKDSLLTLLLVMERVKPEVIWYRTGSQEQRWSIEQWTMKHDLTVYSYQSRNAYYLPMSQHPALVREFDINGEPFPVVVETKAGVGCGLKIREEPLDRFTYPWTETFVGWKDLDTHELANGKIPYAPDGTVIGGSQFFAPIRHMTDDEVFGHLKEIAPEFEDFDDSLPVCTNCFTSKEPQVFCPEEQGMINTLPWDGQVGLANFQKRFLDIGG